MSAFEVPPGHVLMRIEDLERLVAAARTDPPVAPEPAAQSQAFSAYRTSKEIRRENLNLISDGWAARGGRTSQLAAELGMAPSFLNQLQSGACAIGDQVARKIEKRMGYERGYLDAVWDGITPVFRS